MVELCQILTFLMGFLLLFVFTVNDIHSRFKILGFFFLDDGTYFI